MSSSYHKTLDQQHAHSHNHNHNYNHHHLIHDNHNHNHNHEQEQQEQQQHHNHHHHNHHHQQQQQPPHGPENVSLIGDLLPSTTIFYCLLIVCLLFKYKRQRNELKSANIADKLAQSNLKPMPTPPSMPLIGHIHLMRDYQHNPWEGFNAIREQYGDLVSLKMGIHSMVLVSRVELMNEVLIKKGHIFADRPSFPRHDIVFGGDKEHSLALCNWSNTHRARRKFCKRGIVPNKLSARNQLLEKVISEIVNKFMGKIVDNNQEDATVELDASTSIETTNLTANNSVGSCYRVDKNDLLFLTGDIFMKFLCNESRPHSDEAYKNFNIGCDFIFYDINQCYLLDFMPYLTSLGLGYSYLKQLKGVTDYCRDFIDDNIFEPRRLGHIKTKIAAAAAAAAAAKDTTGQSNNGTGDCGEQVNSNDVMKTSGCANRQPQERQQQQQQHTTEPAASGNESGDVDYDYLDSIISEQIEGASSMTLDDYKVGFADLLAGHAAVTNILMRLLGYLALDMSTQEMIHEEATQSKLTSLDYTPPLPVTEAALQEALRLASSPIVPHVAREDSSIGEFFVPKGSAVLFNCYNVNLSPQLWDEPRTFRPTRFLRCSKNAVGETSYKLELPKYFMPFSVGQRQCLGYKMVESISIVAAAHLCAKYKIEANNEDLVKRLLEPKGTVALSPLQECFELKLIPR